MHVRRIVWLLLTVFILYGTTIPFHFAPRFSIVERNSARLATHPLTPDVEQGFSVPDIVQNLLLFFPFGVLGVLAGWPDTRSSVSRIAIVTALGGTLAFVVEAFQLFTLDRVSSVTDAASNTLGTYLGACSVQWLRRGVSPSGFEQSTEEGLFRARTFYPVVVAAIIVCVAAWVPFDATLDVGTVVPKLRTLYSHPWQQSEINYDGRAVIPYALLAMALSAWLNGFGSNHAAVKAGIVAGVVAVGLEATQIAISSRAPGLTDAAVNASAGAIGASLWALGRYRPRPALWLTVFLVATGVATIQTTRPLEIAHLSDRMLVYFTAGFVVAQGLKAAGRAVVVSLIVAAGIASPIEYLRAGGLVRAGLLFFVSLAGAWLGAWAATRGESLFATTAQHTPRVSG